MALDTEGCPSTRGLVPVVPVSGRVETELQLLRRSRTLAVILEVTVICNLLYFAFLPLVHVIAAHLDAGAAMAGIIAATAGMVQLVISAGMVVRPTQRPFTAYTFGVASYLCCLGLLAYTPHVAVALLVLGVAGIGLALFGSTQATLPVDVVEPHERGAALGLLSTTIGVALPTGMLLLGVASNVFGAQPTMLLSVVVGLAVLVATVLSNKQLLTAPPAAVSSGGATGIGGEGDAVSTQPNLG